GYLRRFHNRTTGTVVATADLRDRLHALGFTNLSVLGRGVDGRLFTPARRCAALRAAWGVSEHEVVVLYVGRIAPEQDLDLAVVAYDYAAARMHVTHGETGVLIPYGQASAFVEGAVGLARSPLLLARVRRRAPASLALVAWARVVERFEAILTDALEQRREP